MKLLCTTRASGSSCGTSRRKEEERDSSGGTASAQARGDSIDTMRRKQRRRPDPRETPERPPTRAERASPPQIPRATPKALRAKTARHQRPPRPTTDSTTGLYGRSQHRPTRSHPTRALTVHDTPLLTRGVPTSKQQHERVSQREEAEECRQKIKRERENACVPRGHRGHDRWFMDNQISRNMRNTSHSQKRMRMKQRP